MRCMVIVKATKDSEQGVMPSPELLAAMGKYNEELMKAGIIKEAGGLHPTSHGTRVRFSGPQRIVIDGPFTPVQHQIAGYWIWQVKSMDEAVEWLKRCPNPMLEELRDRNSAGVRGCGFREIAWRQPTSISDQRGHDETLYVS